MQRCTGCPGTDWKKQFIYSMTGLVQNWLVILVLFLSGRKLVHTAAENQLNTSCPPLTLKMPPSFTWLACLKKNPSFCTYCYHLFGHVTTAAADYCFNFFHFSNISVIRAVCIQKCGYVLNAENRINNYEWRQLLTCINFFVL